MSCFYDEEEKNYLKYYSIVCFLDKIVSYRYSINNNFEYFEYYYKS